MTEPTPTQKLDVDLRATMRRYQRLRWILTLIAGCLLLAAAVFGGIVVSRQQDQLTASCELYHDLGVLTIKPVPPLKRVSQVTVTIVLDARRAYLGQCTGSLPPASPSLVYWAQFYHLHIPVRGNL